MKVFECRNYIECLKKKGLYDRFLNEANLTDAEKKSLKETGRCFEETKEKIIKWNNLSKIREFGIDLSFKEKELRYKIRTIDVDTLISCANYEDKGGKTEITFTITSDYVWRNITKQNNELKDTALFYQIRKVLKLDEFCLDIECLNEKIIILDFEDVFMKMAYYEKRGMSYKKADSIPLIFEKGIHYKGVWFVPFDKNDSMARHSKITFIDESLINQLNPRLNLGIDYYKTLRLDLSKFFSRRGLYLSTAERVKSDSLVLDERKVIVIPDDEYTNEDIKEEKRESVITADKIKSNNEKVNIREEKGIIEFKPFDGEGIISPYYSRLINKACGFGHASSYQIRLPFAKGMLHEVDFKTILINEFGVDENEPFYIEDVYGIERNLMDAEIIMPESMFKCVKWLQHGLEDKENRKSDELAKYYTRKNTGEEILDYMKYYFDMLNYYDHALYISNTNLIYGNSEYTKLNYQILNTLDLREDEFNTLVKNHLSLTANIVPISISNDDDPEEVVTIEGKYGKLLEKNKTIACSKKVNQYLQQLNDSYIRDLGRGQLVVSGEVRFFARDLLDYVIYIFNRHSIWENNTGIPQNNDAMVKVKKLKKQRLHRESFFMPENKITLKANEWYAMFRSPHLSRNEQCYLKCYYVGKSKRAKDLYYKYFGHLRGVIFVSRNSYDPLALGGADFDGDIVKIISDRNVCDAVKRGVYKEEEGKILRNKPIVIIPGVDKDILEKTYKPAPEYTSGEFYKLVQNTFSNKTGIISNSSIRIGELEYGELDYEGERRCAHCTILTGMEIDAAKTGLHPNLDGVIKKAEKHKFDYIRDFLEYLENDEGVLQEANHEINSNRYVWTVSEFGKKRQITYNYDEYADWVIHKLPKLYLDNIGIKIAKVVAQKVGRENLYFSFQERENWKETLNQDIVKKVGAVILAYNVLKYTYNQLERITERKSSYKQFFDTILQFQYDREDYETIIQESFIERLVNGNNVTKERVKKLIKEQNWPFLSHSAGQVKEILEEFGFDDEQVKYLSNYSQGGYNLLLFLLQEQIMNSFRKEKEDQLEERFTNINDYDKTSLFSERLQRVDKNRYQEVYEKCKEKVSREYEDKNEDWLDILFNSCKADVDKLMEKLTNEERVMLLFSLTKADAADYSNDFFWRYLPLEVIYVCLKDERVCNQTLEEGKGNAE